MGNLEDILKKHAKRLGIERQVEAVGVVEVAAKEVEKYASKEEFEVISFKEGVLKIGTFSGSAASSIRLGLDQAFLKKYQIKRVVFVEKPTPIEY